jgi:hypothetical protein
MDGMARFSQSVLRLLRAFCADELRQTIRWGVRCEGAESRAIALLMANLSPPSASNSIRLGIST